MAKNAPVAQTKRSAEKCTFAMILDRQSGKAVFRGILAEDHELAPVFLRFRLPLALPRTEIEEATTDS